MQPLTRDDLYSLERYAEARPAFRARVMAHKGPRRIAIGSNVALYFEDRLTIQYQVQEMLRVERIFEPDAIDEELAAYNPLIPDGTNWKATFMIEYQDVDERRDALERLLGIEDRVWVQAARQDRVLAIADEDLERTSADKTASVHFLRFQLPDAMVVRLRDGADLKMGIDHPEYAYQLTVTDASRDALLADLD